MLEMINDFLSGKVLIVLIVGLGSYFTIRSRFVQFRHFFHMFSVFRDSLRSSAGQLSSFQALMLSLAGRVGAGNIAGVGIAVTLGGPGAVFWMWVTALVGMASSFFECTLAQVYKRADGDGLYIGGPAYYIQHGLNKRWMALIFSGSSAFASAKIPPATAMLIHHGERSRTANSEFLFSGARSSRGTTGRARSARCRRILPWCSPR